MLRTLRRSTVGLKTRKRGPGKRLSGKDRLEVAEHLQAAAAAPLVESLVRHADVVLFSAAIPFQGGHHHVNERFPEYWDQLFRRFGYQALDFLRPLIWNNDDVLWWLRQNVLVFARQELTRADGPFAGLAQPGAPLALVHPDLYFMKVQNVRTVKEEHEKLLALLKTGGTFTVVPQADGRLSITRTSWPSGRWGRDAEEAQEIRLGDTSPAETCGVFIDHAAHAGPAGIGIIVEGEKAVSCQQRQGCCANFRVEIARDGLVRVPGPSFSIR